MGTEILSRFAVKVRAEAKGGKKRKATDGNSKNKKIKRNGNDMKSNSKLNKKTSSSKEKSGSKRVIDLTLADHKEQIYREEEYLRRWYAKQMGTIYMDKEALEHTGERLPLSCF